MRYYVVWLENRTSRDDDYWLKIKALDRESARAVARQYTDESRFCIGRAYTLAEMRRDDPEILGFVWGKPAENERRTA